MAIGGITIQRRLLWELMVYHSLIPLALSSHVPLFPNSAYASTIIHSIVFQISPTPLPFIVPHPIYV